ncbi:E3 ubiquitin-protein ligase Topors-like [Gouania willdenowi]|uniref:E3 ubiquitin-protein ligase Topors-like n=1 Tax=Gouania willdenowi TaxID=441366 RepID=UPI001054FEE6|nr:E3 ubiquitin-protein ligase Topors-like [Gouania willdenowi]
MHLQRRGPTSAARDHGVMFEASTSRHQQSQGRYIRTIMLKLAAKRKAASEGRALNNVTEQEMINFRKELYRRGVWVQNVLDDGRFRDPACLQRLIPWLTRELKVLYGDHSSWVNSVQQIIMSRITTNDIKVEAILVELRPFLHGHTDHFLHEFISFAKAPFDMEAYDQHAVYGDDETPVRSHSSTAKQSRTKHRSESATEHVSSDRHSHSRSRSRESHRRGRKRPRSRTYSSSRSPSVRRKSHHDKPGGKRKYKTRHLEESSLHEEGESVATKYKKKNKEKRHKKSKESSRKDSKSLSVELINDKEAQEQSRRHHKKKKKSKEHTD